MRGPSTQCSVCGRELAERLAGRPVWVKDGFNIFECDGCGVRFRFPPPAPEDLAGIYVDDYFVQEGEGRDVSSYRDYLGEEAAHRRNARKRLKSIARLLPDRGRSLDVGAAAGFFVSQAQEEGFEAEGVDISGSMAEFGRSSLGVDLKTGSFLEFMSENGGYDLITMWDYIEHVVDPVAELRHAEGLLRDGGLLVLSTGDVKAFFARLCGKRWHLLTPRHHNFFFSVSSPHMAGRRAGLQPIGTRHPGVVYSIDYLIHKLGIFAPDSAVGMSLSGFASRHGAVKLLVPINLRDIVTVWFRKP